MKVAIRFGALADPIKTQLREQRLTTGDDAITSRFQKIADSIVMLSVHSYIGEREADRLRRKLMKQITKQVRDC